MKNRLIVLSFLFSFNSAFALILKDVESLTKNPELITEIDLSNKGLTEFPKEILACKNLEYLNLSDNGIINIPIEIAELTELKRVNFSGNQGLSYLDLEEVLQAEDFQLEELNLENCEMGYLPKNIGKQKKLTYLNVSGNLLNNLPYSVIQLTKLREVKLKNNRIEDLSWQVLQWWELESLDVSGNTSLKTSELIFSLSAKERLKKLVISNITTLPRSFSRLQVEELEIRESEIVNFPRSETSLPIRKLEFTNCTFKRPNAVVETINASCRPQFLGLNGIDKSALNHFLKVNTDSVDIRNNQLTDISVLTNVKRLSWIDARGNRLKERSVQELKTARPEITLMLSEPIQANRGVSPPFEQFVPQPTIKHIESGKQNSVSVGHTTFDFEPATFLDAQGEVYKGDVALSYTEYFEPADVFLSGITMTSDSLGENLVFSSAGMFELTAADENGNELIMNPEAPVAVDMMSSNPSPDMNLYYLNDSGVWEYKGKDSINQPFKVDMSKLDAAADSAFLNFQKTGLVITENRFIPQISGDRETRSFGISFNELNTDRRRKAVEVSSRGYYIKRPQEAASYIAQNVYIYDGDKDSLDFYRNWFKAVRKKCRKTYSRLADGSAGTSYMWGVNYISKLNIELDNETDRLRLNFSYRDSLVSVPVVLQSKAGNPKGRLKVFEKFYRSLNRYRRKDESLRRSRSRKAQIKINKEEKEIKKLARFREEMHQQAIYEQSVGFGNEEVTASSVSRGFTISGFGIWNCDARRRMRRPRNVPNTFVSGDDRKKINKRPEKITVIDKDLNGVSTFDNPKKAFFDKDSKRTIIVVFFTATMVGIYRSWENRLNGSLDRIPLTQMDVSNMNSATFKQILTAE